MHDFGNHCSAGAFDELVQPPGKTHKDHKEIWKSKEDQKDQLVGKDGCEAPKNQQRTNDSFVGFSVAGCLGHGRTLAACICEICS